MPERAIPPKFAPLDLEAIQEAHDRAVRDAVLEHARMGRPVCEGRDGKVVWISPEEIFARYGFDANGRPIASDPANIIEPPTV
jgi:hypothetical protein